MQTDLNTDSEDDMNTLTRLISEIGVKDCILANMVIHPQYSGKKLTGIKNFFLTPIISCSSKSISDNALLLLESYVNHKHIAENYGCSDNKQSLFYIRHIFCDYVDHQLSLATNGVFYSDAFKRIPVYHKEERFQNSDSIVVEA